METDDLKNDVSLKKETKKTKSSKKSKKTIAKAEETKEELTQPQPPKKAEETKKKKKPSKKKKKTQATAEQLTVSQAEKKIDTDLEPQSMGQIEVGKIPDIALEPRPLGPVEVSKIKVQFLSKEKTAARSQQTASTSSEISEEATDQSQSLQSEDQDEPAVKNMQGGTVTVQPTSANVVTNTNAPAAVESLQALHQVQLAQTVNLPLSAIKIRNVVGKICDLTTEIISNKVIVQGIVHEQLFFVGTDGIVHHLAGDDHFSTFIDVPGAQPCMNADVSAVIEEIITELAPNGLSVTKKIIIQVFVKVTETVQANLQTGDGPLLFVKQVVGENTNQTLVEADITLGVPAIKVDEIVGKICNLETEIIKDKVIIQGILHKQIFFVDTANLGRHQGEDLPFSLFVDVPGVTPGMDVQVHSTIEGIFFELITPTLLRQKAVLEFFVKVTENITLPVLLGDGPLFKVEEFVGENRVQDLSDTTLTLFKPALKIREIVSKLCDLETHVIKDKVIVQGIIHKQIFFIGTDNIEYHQAEDVPFSVFLDILGATSSDSVHLTTEIEAVFFELLTTTQLRQKVIIAIQAVVTREVQLNLVIGTGPLFKLEQVIGENTTQVLVVAEEAITPVSPITPVTPVTPVSPVTISTETIVIPGQIVTNVQQILLNNLVELPEAAIKIKEIIANVTNLSAQVIPDGVLVEGIVDKTVVFVNADNVVRSISEQIPFSILVSIPEISQDQVIRVTVNIEDISFKLVNSGSAANQLIVLEAVVESTTQSPQQFTVVTNVSGPGIVQTKLRVIANVLVSGGGTVTQEIDVVTDVSGPGIGNVTKQVIPLIVVGSGNPNPVPVEVVTDVQLV